MTTEIKGRPVLRPAGNVALRHESKDNKGANARKPTKKPRLSPPLKPTPAAPVKISPPNSQPSTPRSPLIKSPLLKPSASPKLPPSHSPKKPSSSPVTSKPCPPLHHQHASSDPPHIHYHSSPADNFLCHNHTPLDTPHIHHHHHHPGIQNYASPPADTLLPLDKMGLALDEMTDVGLASDEMANMGAVLNLPEHEPVLKSSAEPPLDHASPEDAHETSFLTSSELIYDLDFVNDELISEPDTPAQSESCLSPCGIGLSSCIAEPRATSPKSSSRGISSKPTSMKSPVAQGKPKSRFTRSSSDNFRTGSAREGKVSGSSKNLNVLGSHSLDDASLAHLVAAKKAAALELSAQRKLKVAEYGRKPGKASRVGPEVPSLSSVSAEPPRCKFITAQSDPLHVAYHDQEWGIPLHDDRGLFELLVLAGAQVELNWTTILHRREVYRDAFCGYDPAAVALFSEKHIQSLEADKALSLPGGKICGVVETARRILEVVKEFGSLDNYLWSFLNNKPMINSYRYPKQVPAKTSKSEFISKDLVKRGFRFVGPTIVYSFMQAAGMTNDHLVQCFRHQVCMMQAKSSQGELEQCVVVPCDTPVMPIDADQANHEQLFCKHDKLADHQGQQFDLSETVHI